MKWGRALLASLFLLPACKNGDRKQQSKASVAASVGQWAPARTADLYFTSGTLGYVEPCGCTSKPLGGVQRLASIVERGPDKALLDAGNLFFPKEPLDEVSGDQHRLKAKLLARAYRRLGAVAINLGATEVADGLPLLKALQREGAVPLVSANVRPVGEGGPSIAQSFLRTVGGIKVGITGVATPEDLASTKRLTAIEFVPVVRGEVRMLEKRGAELIVVLAHATEVDVRDLVQEVEGVDVVIRSPGTPITRKPSGPVSVGGTVILEAGSQGQYVGRLQVSLGRAAPERPLRFDDGGYAARRRQDLTRRKIKALERQVAAWKDDPARKEAVAARQGQIARLEAKLSRAQTAGRVTGPSIKFDLVELTEEVPADPEMTAVLEAYYTQLQGMNMSKGDVKRCEVKDKKAATYVGTSQCVECHEEAYDFWKKTKHAVAWKTLEDDGKHFDLTCIGCHTVGYQQPGGFCRLKDVGALKDVGCENCHGPGSLHVEDGDTDLITLTTTEETCAGFCHVPEHSDRFEYVSYLREITGEGHELSDETSAKLPPAP